MGQYEKIKFIIKERQKTVENGVQGEESSRKNWKNRCLLPTGQTISGMGKGWS